MKQLFGWFKILLPAAIIFLLCRHVWRKHPEAVDALKSGETRYSLLFLAFLLILFAHVLCMIRWHLLMTALRIPMRFRDTLRLGFLAHLLNFVGPGQVGGDLFKAVFVAREQPGRRTEAIATILLDRICGLFGLLIVTAVAGWIVGIDQLEYDIGFFVRVTQVLTVASILLAPFALSPRIANGVYANRLAKLPKIGSQIRRLLDALMLYQTQKRRLAWVALTSIAVHAAMAVGMYCTSAAIYSDIPTLAEHFIISKLATAAASLPLTPGGLGSFELAFSYLYNCFSSEEAQGRGVVVGILVHLGIISCAGVGVFFYWWNHREVTQLLKEVEDEAAHRSAIKVSKNN